MEGADFGLVCQCGAENFERVIVRRPGRDPYVTDFVACVGCKAVFHLAAYAETGTRSSRAMRPMPRGPTRSLAAIDAEKTSKPPRSDHA